MKIKDLENKPVEPLFSKAKIKYIKINADSVANFSVGLYGEYYEADLCYMTQFSVDWEKETAYPNIYYADIPLSKPRFLTDSSGKTLIMNAGVGNEGSIDERLFGIFDNDQVMNLLELLTKEYGNPRIHKDEGFFARVEKEYLWDLPGKFIRLSISNECLCKDASSWKGDERPKGGRSGSLTIYYGMKPKFFLEQYNYDTDNTGEE